MPYALNSVVNFTIKYGSVFLKDLICFIALSYFVLEGSNGKNTILIYDDMNNFEISFLIHQLKSECKMVIVIWIING